MNEEIVEAINDLTRVTIALHGEFASKAEAVRKLHELAIPSGRIAKILAMKQPDVTSTIAKLKKRGGSGGKKKHG
jgi:DNA-binding MarR family transcriptional regulator